MTHAALIGDPVEHSVAPVLHTYLAGLSGTSFQYLKIRISRKDLGPSVAALRLLGFAGCNVTLPHKEDVGRHIDRLEEPALRCGAVNTIVFTPNESVGTNTDWIGIEKSLVFFGHPERAAGARAVILGSGGAARAAIYALQQLGYTKITVLYLEPPDAKTARLLGQSERLGIETRPYADLERAVEAGDLVCNMTSAGMAGMSRSPFDLSRLDGIDLAGKYFIDAVFNPVRTPLLQYFEQRGAVTVDGVWMTIFQGIPAFESWNSVKVRISKEQLYELHSVLVGEIDSHKK
ncbi:shikimate dehydrogenase [Actinomadura sp. KC06]|uniref:shikimate dehydrogenase family protein n=1 Tax=Actinomadura sp. KC06 TaxID=2530369 RepID=UPI00104A4693|nr:shikimate dehydrogenase [Actinomadura sp. KC06]TDD34752.1 shikimate dehydrogenase [Actinomadura sp. KC06]